ncbi:monovalent cation:proton antiporter-2 (CPA2) family protein [Acinetobacter boissieri]|uniref:Kef-type potassium/proton antiporter, CPA2 family n=1 Tax=Acinetobacter boissieri TaxID=1219383 RepID=A0A1G6GGQ9_9GAMM|nr:monovalent cation:proton antiporter-2 (CPA2) family protein [Acinetobacter boissieri]SDB81198.1 Kef-type potassium/proton antiporter, CPA2 family [Acinetobacter boissieri]
MSLLLQITLFLAASLLIVPCAKHFGISTVLGYLITGILLGPSVLNIAHDASAVMQLGDFGVIFLMFLIGLELRPQRLWKLRQAIFIMGGLQVTLTGTILMLGTWLIFKQSLAASFCIGFALALSSTAFVLQLLNEKQQLNTSYGQNAFSVLLFQDIAAIPLLAMIPLLAGTSSTHHGIAYFAAIIAVFSGLFLFSRFVMRPFFRFVARSGASELLTAVALFIVLSTVLLMDILGISTTLGAFLTGVLLADSEFRHELESNIAPFKGLLLGLFFMTVGMTTELSVLFSQPLIIIGGAIALLIIKASVMLLIARRYKNSWKNSILLGTCLAQGGEFAFVVFSVAHSQNIISNAITQPVTLIVTLSMVLTPILFWLVSRYVIPRFEVHNSTAFDDIPAHNAPMIIAGFGRVGQIVARIARLQHIPFTAIDSSLQQIHFVRQYGGTLYYGDVTQPQLLRAAGIEHVKIFVLAIDNVEDSIRTARHICLHYPQIKLLVRARNRHHVHLLKDIGVVHIWRETYLSALGMAYQTLRELGIDETEAYQHIELFRGYDEKLLAEQQSIYQDEQKVFETHKNALAELEHLFERDTAVESDAPTVNLKRHPHTSRVDVSRKDS